MWNIITSNRLLDKKRKQQAQRKHLLALKHVKPSIDNKEPQNFTFLYSRPKAKMIKLQRQHQIENSNNILIQKMIGSSKVSNNHTVFLKDSLNYSFNKKIERSIDRENQSLVQRLRNVSSQYGQNTMTKFVNDYQKVKSNLSKSRMNSTLLDLEMPNRATLRNYRSYSSQSRPFSAKV